MRGNTSSLHPMAVALCGIKLFQLVRHWAWHLLKTHFELRGLYRLIVQVLILNTVCVMMLARIKAWTLRVTMGLVLVEIHILIQKLGLRLLSRMQSGASPKLLHFLGRGLDHLTRKSRVCSG